MLFLLTTIIHIIIIVLMYDIFLVHKLQFNDPSAKVLFSRKYSNFPHNNLKILLF